MKRVLFSIALAALAVLAFLPVIGSSISQGGGGAVPAGTFYFKNGSSYFGPVFPMSIPSLVSFTGRNTGGCTITAVGNAITLAASLSSFSLCGQEIVAPATPFSITLQLLQQYTYQDFQNCGLYFADNGTGRITDYGWTGVSGASQLVVSHLTDATTFNGTANAYNRIMYTTGPFTVKIQDTGTNQVFSWSANGGQTFTQTFTEGSTTWLAATNRVGFYCNSQNTGTPATMTALSWSQGV